MTTPTDRHLRIARETGYEGVEVRAERLLVAPEEVAISADMVRPSEIWSLNGIQLQLTPDGGLDRPGSTSAGAWRPLTCSSYRLERRAPTAGARSARCAMA
jgi:hypothetical protein